MKAFVPAAPRRSGDSAARLLVYDGSVLVGCIFATRTAGGRPFSRVELRALQPAVDEVIEAFRRAYRLEVMSWPSTAGEVVLSEDGSVAAESDGGRAWLATRPGAAAVGQIARSIGGLNEPAGEHLSHGLALRWSRVRGPAASGWLVRIAAAPPLRLAPDAWLSPAQRRIAALAATGAPVSEIAAQLDRSPETIRDHLKAIYRRLGVCNRVELTRRLRDE